MRKETSRGDRQGAKEILIEGKEAKGAEGERKKGVDKVGGADKK